MREIKFRVWSSYYGEFIEDFDNFELRLGSPNVVSWTDIACDGHGPDAIGCGGCYDAYVTHDVDEKKFILMQYTGLKDKNGKEIYEGDIVISPKPYNLEHYKGPGLNGFKGEVGYIVCNGIGFHVRHRSFYGECENQVNVIHEGYGLISGYDLWNHQRQFEVIGNIHENPELLEVGR